MNKLSFRFLWIGQTFANTGDVLYIVALITMIYQLTESAFYMTLVPFFITISQFISGMIAPVLMDRYRLKRILAFSQFGKTFLLLGVAFLVTHYYTVEIVPLLFFLVFLLSFLDGWSTPVRDSMVPLLVESDQLVKANSFLSMLDQSVRLGGWSIGGMLVAASLSQQVILITFVLYFGSSILMFLIRESDYIGHDNESEQLPSPKNKWESMKAGWEINWTIPSLKVINIMGILGALADTVWVAAILYLYVEVILESGEEWWGYINATFFLGLIIGGFISLKLSENIRRSLSEIIVWGTLGVSVCTFMFALLSSNWLALLLSLIIGFAGQMKGIAEVTVVQKSTAIEELPKVYAAQYALYLVTYAISVLLIGALTELWGVRLTFLLAATLIMISFMYSFLNRRHLRIEG